MFGRTMRISDDQLPDWYTLVLEQPPPEGDPLEAKLALARFIVRRSWGEDAARAAEEHFTRVVRRHEAPEELEEVQVDGGATHVPALLAERFGRSTSHWRRIVDQGGVKVNGEPVGAYDLTLADGDVLQAGKRLFLRVRTD